MIMWQGYHEEGKYMIMIDCIYDPETKTYEITVSKVGKNDGETLTEQLKAQEIPTDGYMNIKDLEKSVKSANRLLKALNRMRISMEITK